MTPPVGSRCGSGVRSSGTASEVHYLNGWGEEDAPPQDPRCCAEINVFRVEKESFIEKPNGNCICSTNQEASTADPVHEAFGAGLPLDERGDDRECAAMAENKTFLPQFPEGR